MKISRILETTVRVTLPTEILGQTTIEKMKTGSKVGENEFRQEREDITSKKG